MKVEFEKSFMRDFIKNVEDSENLNGLENIKRLKTDMSCFRIKVSDYRIGLKVKGETITSLSEYCIEKTFTDISHKMK